MNFAFTSQCAVGAALAGVVVSLAGTQSALAIDSLSFAACAALLAWRCELPAVAVSPEAILERLRTGIAHVRSDAVLGRLLLGEGVASLLFAVIIPVEIVFVTTTLHGSTADYGLVLTAWGIGMIIGAALVPTLKRFTLRTLSLASLLVMAASYIGMGVAPTILLVTAWSFVGGLGNGVEGFAMLTLVQERTPTALQARVNGLLESMHAIAPGIGFLTGGVIAAELSPRTAYLASGLGALLVVATLAWTLRRDSRPIALSASLAAPRAAETAAVA
jgi:predicted MFS family arabinose efflux permease